MIRITDVAPYEKLRIWQAGQELVLEIYRLTKTFPRHELWGLTSQMRRAAVSIPANIAEGASRGSLKELRQSLLIARGSLAELETYLRLIRELGYAEAVGLSGLWAQCVGLEKGLNAFLASIKRNTA